MWVAFLAPTPARPVLCGGGRPRPKPPTTSTLPALVLARARLTHAFERARPSSPLPSLSFTHCPPTTGALHKSLSHCLLCSLVACYPPTPRPPSHYPFVLHLVLKSCPVPHFIIMHAPRPRPFRRRSLTSLPSLPHPSAPTPPPRSPAMSVPPSRAMSFTSSPPTSPAQASTLPTIPTYEALTQPRANLDRSGLGIGSSNSFARAPTIDEKGPRYIPTQVAAPQPPRDTSGPPKIFGVELKWVS